MAGPFDFTGQKIQDTYGRVVQLVTGSFYDGTGKLINSTIQDIADASNQRQSESIELSAISSSVVELQHFSSSLDADFATDAELSALSSSILVTTNNLADDIDENEEELDNQGTRIATLTAATSSYVTFPYTGSAAISGSLEVIGDTTVSGKLELNTPNNNVIVGYQAGQNDPSNQNVFVGYQAGQNVTAGKHVAIGYQAGRQMTSIQNIAIGHLAGGSGGAYNVTIGADARRNSAGQANISIGHAAFRSHGSNNNAIGIGYAVGRFGGGTGAVLLGYQAGYSLSGDYNIGLGHNVGYDLTGEYNTVLGYESGYYASGSKNVILGYQAGYNLTGSNQLIIANNGSSALITGDFAEEILHISGTLSLNDGNDNTVIGDTNPSLANVAVRNTLIGYKAGHYLESGSDNVFIGYEAGVSESIVGSFNSRDNVAIGPYALSSNGYGGSHTAIGKNALKNVTKGSSNIAIGKNAGSNLSGNVSSNIFIGSVGPSGGSQTIAIGQDAVANNSNGQNIGIGLNAARFSGGTHNLVVGYAAGYNGLGGYTTVLGNFAAYFYQGNSIVALGYRAGNSGVGNNSIIIGKEAGYYASGSDNVIIGYQAGYNLTGSNQLIIANNSSSALITGDFAKETLHISGTILATTGSFSHLKGNSPITVQDPVIFQHDQGLDVLGNATIHSINEVELQTISKDFNYTSSLNVVEITSSVEGAIIDYRLTRLDSGSRVGTFMYAHDGTTLSYNDTTIPGAGLGDEPTLSATLNTGSSIVSIDIENAAGFNFTGYAKKFSKLDNAVPIADPNVSYLLDVNSGAAVAYSLRQLSQFYTGSAIRVREDGANTEADIGFDVNGNLDTAAIDTHCGVNNGYVTIWYDQSGNGNDASQATAGNQPQIHNGSTINTENGKPILIGGYDLISNNYASSTDQTLFSVIKGNGDSTLISDNNSRLLISDAQTGVLPDYGYPNVSYYMNDQLISFASRAEVRTALEGNQRSITALYDDPLSSYLKLGNNVSSQPYDMQELIIYPNQIISRTNVEVNINNYYNIYDTGFLVDHPGASVAYSVRQLTTAYTGSAINIRRTSDNAEQVIGFTSNGDLDTGLIETFCAGTECYVDTWYDQSGNGNDAEQTNANSQPLIYSASAVITENGKPALNLDQQQGMTLTTFAVSQPITVSTVYKTTAVKYSTVFNNSNSSLTDGTMAQSWNFGTPLTLSRTDNTHLHSFGVAEGLNSLFYKNGSLDASGDAGTNNLNITNLGGNGAYNTYTPYFQEFIVWGNNQQTAGNRTNIENNINSYFNIY